MRISIATCGKYRAALRHIDCSERANIDLHKYPLIHRRRDDGPPSPQRLLCNRGKVGVWGSTTAVNLFHKARRSRAGEGWCVGQHDDSQPFPQRLLCNRGRVVIFVFSGALRVRVLIAPPLKNKNNVVKRQRRFCGRGDAIRTRNLWFWRPLLYR